MGQIANRQSLAFSERCQLSQAIPYVEILSTLTVKRTPPPLWPIFASFGRLCQILPIFPILAKETPEFFAKLRLKNLHLTFGSSTWNECCTNEHQLRDSNRSTTNSWVTISVFVGGGGYDHQRTLAIRITAITLASGSAITRRGLYWYALDGTRKKNSKNGEKEPKKTGLKRKKPKMAKNCTKSCQQFPACTIRRVSVGTL